MAAGGGGGGQKSREGRELRVGSWESREVFRMGEDSTVAKKNLNLASLEIVKSSCFEEKSQSCQFGNC
jgi:hypothetical protein